MFKPCDAFGAGLEIEPQGAFNDDFQAAEVGVVEDFAAYLGAAVGIVNQAAGAVLLKLGIELGDVGNMRA